jgi:hypothetical protein
MATTYQIGDLVVVKGRFTDPDEVYCKVKNPAGNITTYEYGVDSELVKDSDGVYSLNIDAITKGTWHYRFYSAGAGQAAAESHFKVENTNF